MNLNWSRSKAFQIKETMREMLKGKVVLLRKLLRKIYKDAVINQGEYYVYEVAQLQKMVFLNHSICVEKVGYDSYG